jgi:hypothetical protein
MCNLSEEVVRWFRLIAKGEINSCGCHAEFLLPETVQFHLIVSVIMDSITGKYGSFESCNCCDVPVVVVGVWRCEMGVKFGDGWRQGVVQLGAFTSLSSKQRGEL